MEQKIYPHAGYKWIMTTIKFQKETNQKKRSREVREIISKQEFCRLDTTLSIFYIDITVITPQELTCD